MKTKLIKKLKKCLHDYTAKQGVFSCFGVSIGWYGNETVDYMTMDTNEIFRCYEIKTSKKDFYSNNTHAFIGHYNYFIMPYDLYCEVGKDIPEHIGAYVYYEHNKNGHDLIYNIKIAKKQKVDYETLNMLKNSIIRSLSREVELFYKTGELKEL